MKDCIAMSCNSLVLYKSYVLAIAGHCCSALHLFLGLCNTLHNTGPFVDELATEKALRGIAAVGGKHDQTHFGTKLTLTVIN